MEAIGGYLKREREFRDISLQEISRTTKIRADILSALEEDRLDSLASPVFVKGFLRAYAQYVGLDPDEVVLRYEAFLKEEQKSKAKKTADDTPGRWILKYIVLPVSILLCLGALLFLALHRSIDVKTKTEPQQISESTESPISRAEPSPPTQVVEGDPVVPMHSHRKDFLLSHPPIHPLRPVTPPPPETPSSIELQIRAVEDTWIQIQIDQRPPEEILLRHGESISRRGEREVIMKIGNAGGVVVICNGENLGKLGESGKVVRLSITPEEVKAGGPGSSLPPNP